jgi:hypothetical protein
MRPGSLKVVTRVRDYWPYNGGKLRASQNRVSKRVIFETMLLLSSACRTEAATQALLHGFL